MARTLTADEVEGILWFVRAGRANALVSLVGLASPEERAFYADSVERAEGLMSLLESPAALEMEEDETQADPD